MRLIIIIMTLLYSNIGISQQVDSVWMTKYLSKFSSDTGRFLPTMNFIDDKGNTKTLEHFKGKITYMNVWDTECGKSILAFAYEEQLLKRLKSIHLDSSIQIINLCTSSSEARWEQIVKDNNPVGINLYCRDTSLFSTWQIGAWPNFILLDSSGKVMGKNITSAQEVITIDYILYAATKGINPIQAAWTNFRQNKLLLEQKNVSALDEDYRKWYISMAQPMIDFFHWRQEHERKNSR